MLLQEITLRNLRLLQDVTIPALGPCRPGAARHPTTGNVQWRHPDRDPRLLTGSELYEESFEIHDLYPTDLARMVDEYRTLAMNPLRPSDSEAEAEPPGAEEALLVLRCDPTTRKYSPHR
jgi:hypothetical protein